MTNATALATRALAPTTAARDAVKAPAKQEAADLSLDFGDLLDAVNPLQHLPGVSQIYRHATGDDIGLPARLAGGFLFGGPIGLLGSAAMAAFEAVTGDDPLGHLVTLAEGGPDETKAPAKDAPSNAPPLPFLAGPAHEHPADHRPSPAVLAEALARKAPGTDAAADAPAPKAEQPAPQILAKLYELHATQPADRPAVRL
ncbi:hypothetical protein ABAZ39_30585 (plasmid) [Azospirillum argentinense]|uniref:Uncharacterized protein n=1 Tax=Azospirillum argentinense TaxID=2970906 RepID=A0A060DQS0_9PROT|nr:hypothetical protein [Azospirillum argentinense]AIB16206.1 hypothetical protein ABAZ39_30585 [Azospirillum argentinense]EZQ02642.1 hypothetical protein ABAZ39_30895 [Azospirillum argentinense]PNQ95920.1 hypothetical protein C1S70_26450 [Azospirillum argentinense]